MTAKAELKDLGLPPQVERVLGDFVEAAKTALGPDLVSVVLYGSAAEGRLRATSDVNAIAVLAAFGPAKIERLREPLRTAYAAVRLGVMFLLESEVKAAAETFSVKFGDVRNRHRVLYGKDPFAGLEVSRQATIARLRQVLLNLTLRLRSGYVLKGLREEQLILAIADAAGPLRACAASLLELEGKKADSPKQALESVASALGGGDSRELLAHLSEAREKRFPAPGAAGPTLLGLMDLAQKMGAQVEKIR